MINGQLLHCPNCQYSTKPQILGRLLDTGEILILRFHSGTTMIKTNDFSIGCGCGFTYLIHQGSISGTIKLQV